MKGLCLSGGGMKASAHIGALKALEEEGIRFECVSGASSGSIIATMYALGYNSDEMWEMFQIYCKKIKYVDWINVFKIIVGLVFERRIIVNGLNSGKIVEKIMKEICMEKGIYKINEIRMPLAIPMVDLQNGTVYIASSKENRGLLLDNTEFITEIPIETAIRASCSFPGVFSPCEYNGLQLIDGGTRENLPWKPLKQIGADEVYGISFDTIYKNDDCCDSLIDVAERAMELQGRELSMYEKEGINKEIRIQSKKVSLLDSSKIYELYRIGYQQTKNQIKKW